MSQPQLREEDANELREFFDRHLKPKNPTMKNLERELLVDFMNNKITKAVKNQVDEFITQYANAESEVGATYETSFILEKLVKSLK